MVHVRQNAGHVHPGRGGRIECMRQAGSGTAGHALTRPQAMTGQARFSSGVSHGNSRAIWLTQSTLRSLLYIDTVRVAEV